MWKWIDSVTTNRLTWIYQSIQSCHLVHTNRLNQVKGMTEMTQSKPSINSIYADLFGKSSISLAFLWKLRSTSLIFLGNVRFLWPFLGNVRFRWPFVGYFEPVQLIQSYQSLKVNQLSLTYFMKTNWLIRQSTHLEKELNHFNQFCGKMNSFKSINSVEMIGIQVWTQSFALFSARNLFSAIQLLIQGIRFSRPPPLQPMGGYLFPLR